MKNKFWLLQLPFVIFCTLAFWVVERGVIGELDNSFLRNQVFPGLRRVEGLVNNLKFWSRGPVPTKKKIVIVEVDNKSISTLGRWPWHRDVTGAVIDGIFQAGAAQVGLDMVLSERDVRVPPELAEVLKANRLGHRVKEFETDFQLEATVAKYHDRLVLGWVGDGDCQPAYVSAEECIVADENAIAAIAEQKPEKFAYSIFQSPPGFDPTLTKLLSVQQMIGNIPEYNEAGAHAGFFNAWPDQDGYIRRTNLVMMANGRPYPSLALEMARIALKDSLEIKLDEHYRIKTLGFMKSKREIPVTPLGVMEVNFRGPSYTFQYVSAVDVLRDEDTIEIFRGPAREIVMASRKEILKDALVFLGVSATGVYDMRAFPFDSNTPGVEGHATILDNLLSEDMLRHGDRTSTIWIFLMMSLGGILFAYLSQKLESVPALLLFLATMSGLWFIDFKLLFANNVNWNTSFLYIEMLSIFAFTIAVKYVLEEQNKKFIRGAFSKYVAPAVVDSILKDPSKLTVGGEKRELTIMFSDIRSFTTFSERLDAKRLAQFLNDYLGIMTDIVFEFNGTLDKYIGDAVMAFWGAPLDQPDHASNACLAAAKMQVVLAQHRQRFLDVYGVEVNIGIGINSGHVNVGNMGSDRVFEYTVIGDHVNLASRLEGLTKPYHSGILTTRFTFDCIQASQKTPPAHRVLDFVKVKGKKKAVELIQVMDHEPNAEGLRLFAEGRDFYTKMQWDQAIEAFRKSNVLMKTAQETVDGPCEMYIERCEEFQKISSRCRLGWELGDA